MREATTFDVLVLGASAGGESAIFTILRELPEDFEVPILLMQHLPVESTFVDVYGARSRFTFEWVREHSLLAPRKMLVCPPRSFVELLPDGSLTLEPCEGGAMQKPIDRLLRSVARSFAHRAIGVVLSGLGNDGAAGALDLHHAGGQVLVQSAGSAQFSDMPKAAIAAGAANLVVPLPDIGQVIMELVAGTPRPKARSELAAIERVFGTAGDIATRAREIDWSKTSIGAALEWPTELRVSVRTMMESPHPMAVWWGPELVQLYNEPWRRFLGVSKHPEALGGRARDTWHEIWDDIGPMLERVTKEGVGVGGEDFRIVIDRHGYPEEIYATFCYSPIRDATGNVVGVHNTVWETTPRVLAERRFKALQTLAARISGASAPREVCQEAAAALASVPPDVPFLLLYLFDAKRRQATLTASAGVPAGSAVAPYTLAVVDDGREVWPLQWLLDADAAADASRIVEDLGRRVPDMPSLLTASANMSAPGTAFMLPLRIASEKAPMGALIAGLSPQRPFDDDYRNFLALIAQHVNAGLAQVRAKQIERERLERLAELDRAKTEFFANVSHEFRTPLTLLLTPLEDMQRRREQLPPYLATEIDAAARHSRRLLRLVNNLLDFSQIETRGQRTALEPTDLASLTKDIASAFRSAIESAGVAFRVNCAPDLPLVPVNRGMWEKVVSNLLSNALKFTFEGEIVVALRALSLHAELVVSDTGIGIAQHELPHLFKRFHRVHGAKARTVEGSGIGLAIVHDLVTRMGGQVQVRSTEHRGTSFRIWMPLKALGRTFERAPASEVTSSATRLASELADEAARWTTDKRPRNAAMLEEALGLPSGEPLRRLAPGARILVVDDNADMRDYLRRLLGAAWNVSLAADGAAALDAAREQRPDLILADVMMPNVDGFALLRAVREDEALKHTPVIFLTARAGEDTAIEGLLAGADDYLAKPFSARELIARVGGQIELARTRRRTEELNAFLVRFSDAVRGISNPAAVAETACRLVADHLRAERAYWSEVDWTTREYVIGAAFERAGVPAVAGRFALDAWEPFTTYHLEGKPVVVDDTQSDPRVPPLVREGYAQLAVGADVAMPVRVNGRLVSLLAVNQRERRHWTAEELALIEAVAGRCWAEIERARGRAAAAVAERRAESILERTSDAHCVLDREYRIVSMNAANERMLGQSRAALIGRSHWEAFPASQDAPVGRAFRRVVQEGVEQHLTHHYTGENYDIHIELDAYPTEEGGVAMFWRDVSERVRTEMALRESEARYASLFAASPVPFLVLDPNPPDFTITAVNEAYLAATLTTRDSLIGRRMFDVFTDDPSRPGEQGSQALAASLARVLETRRPDAMPRTRYDIAKPGGGFEAHWWDPINAPLLDAAGNVTAIIHHVMRVTELHLAEEAERKHRERQAFLLQLSDALRPLGDPLAIIATASEAVGRYLDAGRCGYGELPPPHDQFVVERDWTNGMPSHRGRWRLADFGDELVSENRAGRTLVINDALTDERSGNIEDALQAVGDLRASIGVPLIKDGKWVAAFFVHDSKPRRWSKGDVELVEEIAERTWAAVERARAEAALREELRNTKILQDLSARLVTEENSQAVYEQILSAAIEITRARAGTVQMMDDAAEELVVLATRGFSPRTREYFHRVDARSNTSCGLAMRTGRRSFFDFDPTSADVAVRLHVDDGVLSAQSTPLVSRSGKAIGMVSTHWGERGHRPSERELRFLDLLARQAADLIEQRRAEAALRTSSERTQLVVRFSDSTRGQSDPRVVAETACRMLTAQLGSDRTTWARIDWDTREYVAEWSYMSDGTRAETSRWPFDPGQPFVAEHLGGRTVTYEDVMHDSRIPETARSAMAKRGIRSGIVVPVLVDGTLRAVLSTSQRTPRTWRNEEVTLAEELAGRAWAEVERARAEAALAASEEKYRSLFEQMDEAYAVVEVIDDGAGHWVDFRFLEVNAAFMRHTGMPYPVGRTATELLGTPHPRWAQLYGQAADTGESIRLEESELTLGRVFDLNIFRLGAEGSRRVALLFTDITQRKRA